MGPRRRPYTGAAQLLYSAWADIPLLITSPIRRAAAVAGERRPIYYEGAGSVILDISSPRCNLYEAAKQMAPGLIAAYYIGVALFVSRTQYFLASPLCALRAVDA